MTPQHANQSHGQARRVGVESGVEGTDDQISAGAPMALTRSISDAQTADVDSILDEFDSVIETNAAAFVQGFVQKGGQ